MSDYLVSTLLKKPVLLTVRFNPEEYVIDMTVAAEQSTAAYHAKNARVVYGGAWDDDDDDEDDIDKPYAIANGIALIPITGILLNRFSYSFSMATGYNALREMVQTALNDDSVQGIVFDVNSPGGMVQGCFELADEIYAARGTKPMMAVVDAQCTSAAYAIASSADSIIATRSADVGSIGVVCMHADLSGMLDKAGVDVTFIYAGKHKIDGNPFEPLPAGVKADLQASIDATYEDFVSLVARNRALPTQNIRDTEAQVYGAQDAMNLRLIDGVATPAEAITAFRSDLKPRSISYVGDFAMTEKVQPGAQQAQPDPAILAAAAAEAAKTATATERARINAILTSDEAKDRSELASYIALSTDLSVDAAKAMLKASPAKAAPAAAAAAANPFADAMAKNNPNVSAGSGEAPEDPVSRILANFAQASGNRKTA